MIPGTLDAWNIKALQDLIDAGVYESDIFDFKEMLPDRRDDPAKFRLAKTCAAFANSEGGFLVFGVKDSGPSGERIAGIDASIDFPEHFGNYPSKVSPSIQWTTLNPPLSLPGGKKIHVVHILKGWKAPHAVESSGQALTFPKRTNSGNEIMSYSEVQGMFLGSYEKRLKLQLLKAEVSVISDDAAGMIIEEERNDGSVYGLPTIELRLLETILSDTYSITQSSDALIAALTALRAKARIVNNKVAVFRLEVALPMTNKATTVKDHNDFVRPHCEQIIKLAAEAVSELEAISGV